MEILLFLLCAIWMVVLVYLGVMGVVMSYRKRKPEKSIVYALDNWMVSCIHDCDFKKAFRIHQVANRETAFKDYASFIKFVVYPRTIRDFVKSQEVFKLSTNADDTVFAIDHMSVCEKRFDSVYAEVKKLF